jgi:hypothetical protein
MKEISCSFTVENIVSAPSIHSGSHSIAATSARPICHSTATIVIIAVHVVIVVVV